VAAEKQVAVPVEVLPRAPHLEALPPQQQRFNVWTDAHRWRQAQVEQGRRPPTPAVSSTAAVESEAEALARRQLQVELQGSEELAESARRRSRITEEVRERHRALLGDCRAFADSEARAEAAARSAEKRAQAAEEARDRARAELVVEAAAVSQTRDHARVVLAEEAAVASQAQAELVCTKEILHNVLGDRSALEAHVQELELQLAEERDERAELEIEGQALCTQVRWLEQQGALAQTSHGLGFRCLEEMSGQVGHAVQEMSALRRQERSLRRLLRESEAEAQAAMAGRLLAEDARTRQAEEGRAVVLELEGELARARREAEDAESSAAQTHRARVGELELEVDAARVASSALGRVCQVLGG